jgi:hypothetical protein
MLNNEDVIDKGKSSLDEHPPLHRKVLVKASELAEPAVRLRPPFDLIINTKLWRRSRFPSLESLDLKEKEDVLEAMIATAKFDMCGEAFRDQELIERLYAFDNSRRDTAKLLRETAEFAKKPPRDLDLRERPIIIDVMNRRYPEFKYDDQPLKPFGRAKTEVLCFSKSFMNSNKIIIIIGTSSVRMETLIGIATPFYTIKDGNPWETSGSWGYRDASSCEQAINDALDVVDIVITPFAEKMTEALG